jgi:hypothetical protein
MSRAKPLRIILLVRSRIGFRVDETMATLQCPSPRVRIEVHQRWIRPGDAELVRMQRPRRVIRAQEINIRTRPAMETLFLVLVDRL